MTARRSAELTRLAFVVALVAGLILTVLAFAAQSVEVGWTAGAVTVGAVLGIVWPPPR